MSMKVAQNDFFRNMIDFDTFTKIACKNGGDFGKLKKDLKNCQKL